MPMMRIKRRMRCWPAWALIVLLGLMVGCSSMLEDLIGAGNHAQFGLTQAALTVLGILLFLCGLVVYRKTLIGNR